MRQRLVCSEPRCELARSRLLAWTLQRLERPRLLDCLETRWLTLEKHLAELVREFSPELQQLAAHLLQHHELELRKPQPVKTVRKTPRLQLRLLLPQQLATVQLQQDALTWLWRHLLRVTLEKRV